MGVDLGYFGASCGANSRNISALPPKWYFVLYQYNEDVINNFEYFYIYKFKVKIGSLHR